MSADVTLHSGQFKDRDDNIIKVTFFKRYDLHTSTNTLTFHPGAGTLQVTIWSKNGDADLSDSQVDWLDWTQASSEKIPYTNYYKYTYNVTATANSTGANRTTTLTVSIEGVSASAVSETITITQHGTYTIYTSTDVLDFDHEGQTQQVTIWSYDGDTYLSDSQVDWMSWSQASAEQLPGSEFYKYTYDITCTANSGSERTTTVRALIEGVSASVVSETIRLVQENYS